MRRLILCFVLIAVSAPLTALGEEPPPAQPPAQPPPAQAKPPAPEPAKPKTLSVAFFQLEAQHVDPKTAAIVSDELLVLLSKMPGSNVMGSREVDAMLGYEQKKQMSGCTDTSCMVAIGGALGVDKILMGAIGKLGESYILNLKLLDIRLGKVEQLYSKRLKGGKEEDFLDILPEACAAIFPASAGTWVKTDKKPDKPPEQIQVVDLQRKPGEIKIPEKKPDEPTPMQQMAQKVEGKSEPPKPEPTKPAQVEKKAEPEEPPGPYSHDGQFYAALKGNLVLVPSGMSSEVHIGWAPSKWFEFGVGGIIAVAKGAVLRGTVFVYNPDGMVKPFVGLQIPALYSSDGMVLGAGGSLGVQWDFWKHMGLTLELPVDYMFVAPDKPAENIKYEKVIVMGTAGVQARF